MPCNISYYTSVVQVFDLDSVDITTPLRADEVFTVQKHREVPVSMSTTLADMDGTEREEAGKKKKSSKKSKDKDKEVDDIDAKKSKKDKDKLKSKKVTSEPASNDLLMMDWNDPPMPSLQMAMPVIIHAPAEVHSSKKKGVTSKEKEKEKEKGKKSNHVWLPLLSDKTVDLYYSTTASQNTITITLKAVNSSKSNGTVSVTATFTSSAAVRPATPSNSNVRVASQLAPGDSNSASTDLVLIGEASTGLTTNLSVNCTAHISFDSLLGPDTKSMAAALKIPVCSTFCPNKLDEKSFLALMGKSSSRWASASVKVPCSVKPKTALKTVSSFLHTHTVEAENARAASLAAKSVNGGTVCCLAKMSKDGNSVGIDIKCLCASKIESVTLVEAIADALADLSL